MKKYLYRNIKKILLFLYWKRRNIFEGLDVQNYGVPGTTIIGKKVMIRQGTVIGKIKIGDYSYISGPNTFVEEAIIGKFCSIARNVTIGVSGHDYNWVTTSLISVKKKYGFVNEDFKYKQKSAPIIGNDVWIGMNSIILRGVKIGNGAIIAAGAIVTKDVPPYSIVAGNPAEIIKYRYSIELIEILQNLKWWDWPDAKIKDNIDLMKDVTSFVKKHSPK